MTDTLTLKGSTPYSWQNVPVSLNEEKIEEEVQAHSQSRPSPWVEVDMKKSTSLIVWRISNYTCSPIPQQQYGEFYSEDVYIVARATAKPQKKKKDPLQVAITAHLWVGKMATRDDYIAGIWFLKKMDKKFNDVIIFREAQEMESTAFKQFFKTLTYWKGSFEDSYLMCLVRGDTYRAKLLKMSSDQALAERIVATEIPCKMKELDPAFTFALDVGHSMFLWHGNLTPTEDDLQAIRYLESIKVTRGCDTKIQALDDDTPPGDHPFYTYLSKESYKQAESSESTLQRSSTLPRQAPPIELYRPVVRKSTATPTTQFECVKKGKISKSDLDHYPFCILSTLDAVFICLDKKLSADIGIRALARGQEFLCQSSTPLRPLILLRYKQTHAMLAAYLMKK